MGFGAGFTQQQRDERSLDQDIMLPSHVGALSLLTGECRSPVSLSQTPRSEGQLVSLLPTDHTVT